MTEAATTKVVITPGNPDCNIQKHDTHAQKGEVVEWVNKTADDVGIDFIAGTPFDEASFTIPANGAVKKVINEDAETSKKYPYNASCQAPPPGPPGIIVDPPN